MRYLQLGEGKLSSQGLKLIAAWLLSVSFSGCSLYHPPIEDLAPFGPQPNLAALTVIHRGNISRGELPDNSLPALRYTLSFGIDSAEVDVRLANDGSLFLFHDGSFSRGNSNAPFRLRGIPISELTQAERAQVTLDSSNSVTIPSLADALSLLEQTPERRFRFQGGELILSLLQLDLKGESDELALAVLKLLAERNLLARALIQVRSAERIELLLKRYPKAQILARCKSQKELEQALKHRIIAVELERWISPEALSLAHSHGVLVGVNVAGSQYDTSKDHKYLRSRGVDLIMTDNPNFSSQETSAADQG